MRGGRSTTSVRKQRASFYDTNMCAMPDACEILELSPTGTGRATTKSLTSTAEG
jgi:hypothetical protein